MPGTRVKTRTCSQTIRHLRLALEIPRTVIRITARPTLEILLQAPHPTLHQAPHPTLHLDLLLRLVEVEFDSAHPLLLHQDPFPETQTAHRHEFVAAQNFLIEILFSPYFYFHKFFFVNKLEKLKNTPHYCPKSRIKRSKN